MDGMAWGQATGMGTDERESHTWETSQGEKYPWASQLLTQCPKNVGPEADDLDSAKETEKHPGYHHQTQGEGQNPHTQVEMNCHPHQISKRPQVEAWAKEKQAQPPQAQPQLSPVQPSH